MSMSSNSKSELQMLRELAWFLLPHLECRFCHEPIMRHPQGAMTFGHRHHPPVETRFSIHHENRDRFDNRREGLHAISHPLNTPVLSQMAGNIKIAHKRCHDQFHAKERADVKRLAVAG